MQTTASLKIEGVDSQDKCRTWVLAVVEDDQDLREELEYRFRCIGYTVWGAPSVEVFYRSLALQPADIALIDIGLPGEDGLSLIRHLATQKRMALVVLSARGSVSERVEGLKAGADLYFAKPFSFQELEIAIERLLNRLTVPSTSTSSADVVDKSAPRRWRLDFSHAELISPADQRMPLTSRELELLELLIKAKNAMVSKGEVMDALDLKSEEDWQRVNAMIYRLRQKTQSTLGARLPLRAVFGKGLCFVTHD